MERAIARVKEVGNQNKARFDRTDQLRPKKIEEGDWVLVYDISLDKQHRSTRNFAKRWFGPYVVINVNDNVTYHLAELSGTRMRTPVAWKRIKAFKRRNEAEPDPTVGAQSGGSKEEGLGFQDPSLNSLSGTYRRMCSLVGVDVVKIPGHKRKQHKIRGNTGVHECTSLLN